MPQEPDPTTLTAPKGSPKLHFSLDVRFPVYALAWINDETLVLAGGGGGSRTGVRNRISIYRVSPSTRTLTLLHSHTLSSAEDAPMTIAPYLPAHALVAGINSAPDELARGTNDNLRVFEYAGLDAEGGVKERDAVEEQVKVEEKRRKQTLKAADPDQYQKITAFTRPPPSNSHTADATASSRPALVALGSTNAQLSLLNWPELDDVYPPISFARDGGFEGRKEGQKKEDDEEVIDVDFDDSGEMLIGTSSTRLAIYPTTRSPYISRPPEPLQVIERPVLKKEMKCTFRAAKFGRRETASHLYTVVNAAPLIPSSLSQKQRKAFEKKAPKKAFVSLWDTATWTLVKTRTVCQKPVTCFEVSDDGELLAYGGSDLSVGVISARTLRPIVTILHAHDFPVTALKFNPAGTVLVSGSADNSVRVITVPRDGSTTSSSSSATTTYALLVTLLILLIAVVVQMGLGDEVLRAARGAGL
ncbi:hypothetical protein JCM10207_003284 [Rhodosporidiobolus poonsookiae]